MRLVLAALTRPITVVVALIAVALCAFLAVQRMPVDIFPQVGDPAIYVAQPYGGMDPAQMEGYLTYYYEYHFLYITGIDHVESKSIQGAALMKLVFHEGTDMSQAMAETVGYVNRARAFMPPGTVPPFITRFDAGSVAVGQLVFSSADAHAKARCRITRSTACGRCSRRCRAFPRRRRLAATSARSSITLDPDKLRQYEISPDEAIAAVSKSSVVMPSGNMCTGHDEPDRAHKCRARRQSCGAAEHADPAEAGTTVYLRDIGTIENGTDLITAYAHVNGKRTVYIPVTKRADASTLAVINAVKAAMPTFKKVVPEDVDVRLEFDQSPYVTKSIRRLSNEGLLGALLTGLMVLIFLRDWRSALIVVLNIPFALLSGGYLSVGHGADDQHHDARRTGACRRRPGGRSNGRNREYPHANAPGVSRARAVVEACSRTAMARLLSMFCVLAVFVPSFFMAGVARQLFVPLSLAVGFCDDRVVFAFEQLGAGILDLAAAGGESVKREGLFDKFRSLYESYLRLVLRLRWLLVPVYVLTAGAVLYVLLPLMGTEIFPDVERRSVPHPLARADRERAWKKPSASCCMR